MAKINLNEIYEHKLNFLIGAGASSGLFPTLWLSLKDKDNPDKQETIETLATKLEELNRKKHLALLFMYYYQKIIEPVCGFKLQDVISDAHNCENPEECSDCEKNKVIDNYRIFIESLVRLLQHKSIFSRRCNLFTTNYDGCIPFVADLLIKKGAIKFHINDGATGFLERTLSAQNFTNYLCQSGIFGKNSSDIPQINFINLHGSAYWRKSGNVIKVDYASAVADVELPSNAIDYVQKLESILNNEDKTIDDVLDIEIDISETDIDRFWKSYNKLPIVNPTKWKFHETVFEEHYYQMLRLLSYQLEEAHSVLISFAFSFADEHILNLVKRSLSNPKLQVYICCFNLNEYEVMMERFKGYKNVKLIKLDNVALDFTKFNTEVFNTAVLKDQI